MSFCNKKVPQLIAKTEQQLHVSNEKSSIENVTNFVL
jgi:hypothetical protein